MPTKALRSIDRREFFVHLKTNIGMLEEKTQQQNENGTENHDPLMLIVNADIEKDMVPQKSEPTPRPLYVYGPKAEQLSRPKKRS